jgi:hypothetical protein
MNRPHNIERKAEPICINQCHLLKPAHIPSADTQEAAGMNRKIIRSIAIALLLLLITTVLH